MTQHTHWIGKTGVIAKVLFAKLERLKADPNMDRLDRCWLFTGPPGNGKTTLAEALAKAYIEHKAYLDYINGQSCTIEVVRRWRESAHFKPLANMVQFVDEIDAASLAAANELRTHLDNLPSRTLFIATTNKPIDQLQEQLQSRFQVQYFTAIPEQTMAPWLVDKYRIAVDIAQRIASGAKGNVRAAILDTKSHLDMLAAV
jgi:DNA polymerase III delta prime subunit